jgi:predicted cobalt transporter CbtA
MVGNILLRGMLVGLMAGVIAFGFARVFGEPQVDAAIAFEEAQSQAKSSTKGAAAEPEIVSRETQAGAGLLTGVLVYSAAVGGLFSLVFAFVYGRFGSTDARSTAALLALAGFVAVVLVPALKYAPNPPSVGDPETIAVRTELYFLMLLSSVSSLVLAFSLTRILQTRFGLFNAAIAGGAVYFLLMAIVGYALPAINEVPENFSAMLLWNFRVAALGIQLILWTVLGLVFGMTVEQRLVTRSREPHLAT